MRSILRLIPSWKVAVFFLSTKSESRKYKKNTHISLECKQSLKLTHVVVLPVTVANQSTGYMTSLRSGLKTIWGSGCHKDDRVFLLGLCRTGGCHSVLSQIGTLSNSSCFPNDSGLSNGCPLVRRQEILHVVIATYLGTLSGMLEAFEVWFSVPHSR